MINLGQHIEIAQKHGTSKFAIFELKDTFGNVSALDAFIDQSGWVFCKLGNESLDNLGSGKLIMHTKTHGDLNTVVEGVSDWIKRGYRKVKAVHTT